MPRDVLQHHDGVIHDEAGGDNQRHQRQVVEAVAEQVHHRAGPDQRHRQRQRRDRHRLQVAQEDKHHGDHQQHGDQQRLFGIVERGAHPWRPVDHHFQLRVGGQIFLQRRQLRLNGVNGVEHIGARLTLNADHHRGRGVEETSLILILHRVVDGGDVVQPHRFAILISDDQIAELRGLVELAVAVHHPRLAAALQHAFRQISGTVGDGAAHAIQRDAVVRQLLGLQVDTHRGQRAAHQRYLAHALHLPHRLLNLAFGQIVQLAGGARFGGERQHHDGRVGGIGFAVGRQRRHAARQQAARGVDRRLHVTRRAVDIAVQLKL